jgi:poly(3-hydroxybutyrate) depolymerase
VKLNFALVFRPFLCLATCLGLMPRLSWAEEAAGPVAVAGEKPAALSPMGLWFKARLEGESPAVPDDRALDAKQAAAARDVLWAEYKAAALALGWDRRIAPAPAFPSLASPREFKDRRDELPQLQPAVMPADGENMPYFLFSRGEKPAAGFPLFLQMHGGGSTDEKLPHPHGWPINTRDWRNQIGVCLFALPEGLYFVPRMANDNKGRWWMKHNHVAFDHIIRLAVLFRDVDPERIYMTGISEGAYGTEALTPFWADRLAGACAMAGGAGGGERFYNLRNTAFRNDTGENDTMFGRIRLAREAHDYLAKLKQADPGGYDHMLFVHEGMGHSIDYAPGPAWIATKTRKTRPEMVVWFNFALDGRRRTDFSWLSLAAPPGRDTWISASINRAANRIEVSALVNPPGKKDESPVYNTSTPEQVANRIPYTGNTLILHLDDTLADLNQPLTVIVNGRQAFYGNIERKIGHMAEDIIRHGDPGRVFPARLALDL